MSHVMGMQVGDVERDRAMPTFFIKPVNLEGEGIKGADRLEDKGECYHNFCHILCTFLSYN